MLKRENKALDKFIKTKTIPENTLTLTIQSIPTV